MAYQLLCRRMFCQAKSKVIETTNGTNLVDLSLLGN